ncbi:MAG: hypothetical protein LC713_02580, partial [Actinobacteria bacterium]|nr:hypothetical protein [Actinomycetota bacterium]
GNQQRARELLASARTGFADLNLALHEERVATQLADIGTTTSGSRASFRREADGWVIDYGDRSVRVRDSRGLRYLSLLLTHPGQAFSATELIDGDANTDPERARQNVARAARSAMERIAEVHPELGEHLGTAVHVGASCCYMSDSRATVIWAS